MKENGGLFTSNIRRATYFVGRKVQRAVRQDTQLLQGRFWTTISQELDVEGSFKHLL